MSLTRRRSPPLDDPQRALLLKDYHTAAQIYRRWIAEDPRGASNWRKRLAEALALAGRVDEAISEYLTAAAALLRDDRPVQALALYRAVLRLDPRNAEVRARLGEIAADAPPTGAKPAVGAGAITIRTRLRRFVPLFSELSREELTSVVEAMVQRQLLAGHVVFRQQDPGDSLFIVSQGEVALTVTDRDGQSIELERIGDGGFFGEVSALTRSPRNVTATCTKPSELLELGRDYLEAVATAHPRIWDVLERFQKRRPAPVGL